MTPNGVFECGAADLTIDRVADSYDAYKCLLHVIVGFALRPKVPSPVRRVADYTDHVV